MRFIVLINLLMMLIHTTGLTETATTGNLLPNAGTGQTNQQHSNSTIDGINSSNGFTLNNITDYSSNYNELEAQGTGTVSASGTLLDISAGDHTTTTDSLDGGVTLTSKTEVQNCEWIGSSSQCGQATSGRDSYSTTVTILDENNTELATVTQNRNNDSGYNNNTFTYTDTVTHTGEGARKWEWEWQGIDGNSPNSTSPVGPNLLGAELKATLLDILYSPLPVAIKEEIEDIFEELITEFEEIENVVELEEEFQFEELTIEEEPIEMEEPVMVVMMEITEEEAIEEEIMFEEIVMEEEKEEEEPVMEIIEMFTEEESEEEEPIEMITEAANAQEESDEKQKEVQSEKTRTVELTDVLNKIDEKIKDIDKNLQLKNLVKLKIMSSNNLLEAYNIPFYEPKIIYEDQINIEDNRVIYTQDLVEYKQSDPIFIKKQQLNNVLQRRQNLINELQVLQNG
jgi:hypothetical protein